MLRQVLMLVVFVGLCQAVAAIGGLVTASSVGDWYTTLNKPTWTPSGRVIGGVWTVLYTLMGVAGWLAWRKAGFAGASPALTLFAVQLGLNLGWSVAFFGLRSPGLAMLELVVLWIAIAATTAALWRVTVSAGALFLPYLAWVSFAGVLNWAIWRMNTGTMTG
jgi:benzodiazapine receptor